MKKILAVLILGILLVGCSDGDTTDEKSSDDTGSGTKTENVDKSDQNKEEKKVYQIGEKAVITSDMYDFDYEVTVNDFKLTRKVDGVKLNDFLSGANDEDRFAVVNTTIKNISDEAYVPNEMFSANFAAKGEKSGDISYDDDFFTERDKELKPGDEITGNIVYITRVNQADTFEIMFEVMSDEETRFELPNPEK